MYGAQDAQGILCCRRHGLEVLLWWEAHTGVGACQELQKWELDRGTLDRGMPLPDPTLALCLLPKTVVHTQGKVGPDALPRASPNLTRKG